jgi:hypothetical protein
MSEPVRTIGLCEEELCRIVKQGTRSVWLGSAGAVEPSGAAAYNKAFERNACAVVARVGTSWPSSALMVRVGTHSAHFL